MKNDVTYERYDKISCKTPSILVEGANIRYPEILFINIRNKSNNNAIFPDTLTQIADRLDSVRGRVNYVVFYPGSYPPQQPLQRGLRGRLNNFLNILFPYESSLLSEGAFSVGADVPYMASQTNETAYGFSRVGQIAIQRIEKSPLIKIAAIDGFCIGGGCELAAACDFRISSPKAKFLMPEKRLGILPGWGGCSRLQRHVGTEETLKILSDGEKRLSLKPEKAFEIGFVDYVASEGDIAQTVFDMILEGYFDNMNSRSRNSQEKSPLLPRNDLEEARLFQEAFRNGAPESMIRHIESEKARSINN